MSLTHSFDSENRFIFLLDRFSFPPHEGVQEQYLKLFEVFSELGIGIDIYAHVRMQDKREWKQLEANYSNVRLCAEAPEATNFYRQILLNYVRSVRFQSSGQYFERVFGRKVTPNAPLYVSGPAFLPLASIFGDRATIFSPVDAYSLRFKRFAEDATGWRRHLNRVKQYLLASVEVSNLVYPRCVQVVSELDAQYLRQLKAGIPPILAIPQIFNFPDIGGDNRVNYDLVFSGNLDLDYVREGLLEFLNDTFSRIRLARRNCTLLVHSSRSRRIQTLRQTVDLSGVEFVEYVDDYNQMLASGRIVIFPDKSGTGIKNRVLHATAAGRPVVATRWVYEGLPLRDNVHGRICDSPEEFSEAILELLHAPEKRDRLARAAREVLESEFGWERSQLRWKSVIDLALRRSSQIECW